MNIKKVFIIAFAVFTSILLTTCKKVEVPTQPTEVKAWQEGVSVIISWKSVKNATNYRIYRSATGKDYDIPIGTISTNSKYEFVDKNPLEGMNYYKVTAFNEDVESLEGGYATCNFSFTETNFVTINGVKWATCNVAAPGTFTANPEEVGMFYQWNRKVGWSSTDPMINSNGETIWDNSLPWGTSWSYNPSPAGFRVPSNSEFQTLLNKDKVTCIGTTRNGIYGRLFTDKTTGNAIFLPVTGYRGNSGTLYDVGIEGYYWSSTDLSNTSYGDAYALRGTNMFYCYETYGLSVRPVAE